MATSIEAIKQAKEWNEFFDGLLVYMKLNNFESTQDLWNYLKEDKGNRDVFLHSASELFMHQEWESAEKLLDSYELECRVTGGGNKGYLRFLILSGAMAQCMPTKEKKWWQVWKRN